MIGVARRCQAKLRPPRDRARIPQASPANRPPRGRQTARIP
jgi:hypothetical protein